MAKNNDPEIVKAAKAARASKAKADKAAAAAKIDAKADNLVETEKTVSAQPTCLKLYNNMRCLYMVPNSLVNGIESYSGDVRESIHYKKANRLRPGQSIELERKAYNFFTKKNPKAFQAYLDNNLLVVIDAPRTMDMRDAQDLKTRGAPKSIGGTEVDDDELGDVVETLTEPVTFLQSVKKTTVDA